MCVCVFACVMGYEINGDWREKERARKRWGVFGEKSKMKEAKKKTNVIQNLHSLIIV